MKDIEYGELDFCDHPLCCIRLDALKSIRRCIPNYQLRYSDVVVAQIASIDGLVKARDLREVSVYQWKIKDSANCGLIMIDMTKFIVIGCSVS